MKRKVNLTQKEVQGMIIKECNRLGIPHPDHKHGYTGRLISSFLSKDELVKFNNWMGGQTCGLDTKYGVISYVSDVLRGVDLIRNNTPTYFD